jgi:hypothetical protein
MGIKSAMYVKDWEKLMVLESGLIVLFAAEAGIAPNVELLV